MNDILFSPTRLGSIELSNRILMAPMTRSRASKDGVPTPMMLDYYQQRASSGLIITEGTQPSASGQGYCRTPGIYTDQHIEAWHEITQAVAKEGGNMVMQIMHCGRISNHLNRSENVQTVAPSAIQAAGQIYTDQQGMADHDMPVELSVDGIQEVIKEYVIAAKNAVQAGFAGVELHATSGYLPAQFLSTGTNQRSDSYGGSVEQRCKFVVDVLAAMNQAIGADRVGMRICPGNPFNDLKDNDPNETFSTLLQKVTPMGLAYLHVIRMEESLFGVDTLKLAQENFAGKLIINDSYKPDTAAEAINKGQAEAVSFGRHYIANPDLVARFKNGIELSRFDPSSLYSPDAEGYSSYLPHG